MRAIVVAVVLAMSVGPAAAQAVSGDQARRQLFPTRGVQAAVSRALSEIERATISEMISEAERTGQSFRYYGSIAYSPSEGLTGQSIRGAFNYHTTEAADRAAVAECNAARASGSEPCQVAAHILPRRYEPGRLQLSYDATNGFRSTYRGIRGAKALAISPQTGAWQMAQGSNTDDAVSTAVALCNEAAVEIGGSGDCTAVIVN